MPTGPDDYMNDFERIMAPAEEKYDRLKDHTAKEYMPDLLARARLIGLSMPAIHKLLVEEKRTLGEIERMIARRSTQV
jgi:hypothetical protein